MGETRTTDISVLDPADGPPPSGKSARLARFLGEIVSAASMLSAGEFQHSPLGCRRRPQRRPCPGRLELGRERGTDAIRWCCSKCADQGVITNWRDTRWDLGRELKDGRVVSLSQARARRALQRKVSPDVEVLEVRVELIDGPYALDQLVTRKLRIGSDKTLQDLHVLLCTAYDRPTDLPYEFLFGAPYEPDARRFSGVADNVVDDVPCETLIRLDELKLQTGQAFGYLFDFDSEWIHRLTILARRAGRSSAAVTERVGASPPMDEQSWADETLWDDIDDDDCPLSEIYGPYTADDAPDADVWLGMEEPERALLVLECHARTLPKDHPSTDSPLLHAMLHELAETALAEGRACEHDRLQRCLARGMSRHAAIHEMGRNLALGLLGGGARRPRPGRRR